MAFTRFRTRRQLPPPSRPVEYANPRSRRVLRQSFELQFVIPLHRPPRLSQAFVDWYGRHRMKVDISDITVDRPIFLVGLPRSGTTVLQDIFCAHPDVAYITNAMNSNRNTFWATEALRKRLKLDFTGERFLDDGVMIGPGTANEGHGFLMDWLGLDPWSLESRAYTGGRLTPERAARAHEAIRRVMWCHGGPRRFFLKNPGLVTHSLFIRDLFPDARIIHLVRDPRMVANSLIKLYGRHRDQEAYVRARLGQPINGRQPFVPYPRVPNLSSYVEQYGAESIQTTARVWNDAISAVNSIKSQLPCFYELRHEDLVANPSEEIAKLARFCDLEPPTDRSAPFWQHVDGLRVVPAGKQYRDYEAVEEICADNMRRYGYL
jgi:sulfotransferase family protein